MRGRPAFPLAPLPLKFTTTNYFKVSASREIFSFDDSDRESVTAAWLSAEACRDSLRANRRGEPRKSIHVCVYRRPKLPDPRWLGVPLVGDVVSPVERTHDRVVLS